MAWRQNHYCMRMRNENVLERFEQQRFLILNRASANQHWSCARLLQGSPQGLHNWRRFRKRHIKLEIAGGSDSLWCGSNGLQPVTVLPGLREKQVDVRQHSAQR